MTGYGDLQDIVVVLAASVFSWMLLASAAGLLWVSLSGLDPTSFRELVAVPLLLFPLKSFYQMDEISEEVVEWIQENSVVLLSSIGAVSVLELLSSAKVFYSVTSYYSLLGHAVSSVFLRAELLFRDFFGSMASSLLYGFSSLYLEVLAVFVVTSGLKSISENLRGEIGG